MTGSDVLDIEWTDAQRAIYEEDGFLVVDCIIGPAFADTLRPRYSPICAGKFENGTTPDHFPTKLEEGDHAPETRWMANPWRADYALANFAFHPGIGKLIATLAGWLGARLLQNNIHWKLPGAPELSMHQDSAYHKWCVPSDLCTCWVTLTDTTADGGTLRFVRGSHKWPRIEMEDYLARVAALQQDFRGLLDPKDCDTFVKVSADHAGVESEIVLVEVPKGGGSFHHDFLWHGSDRNCSDHHRQSISSHAIRPETKFHPTEPADAWGRYKRFGDTEMDETHLPILWSRDGYRTAAMGKCMRPGSGASIAA
jgi:ectoine hydroxylase-related dioxygenase (phytanoyl-CoA dioxygenase family)